PDHEQRRHDEEGEDHHRLHQDDPAVVLGEAHCRVVGAAPGGRHEREQAHPAPPRAICTTAPAPARRLSYTVDDCESAGSQTTRSGRSSTRTGRVIRPDDVDTTTSSPSSTPTSAAVAAESRATGRVAVPAR